MMLDTIVALEDVDNVEAFVRAEIERFEAKRQRLPREMFEHLLLEGIVVMYELAERFDPHRPGYSGPGRFSGYAAWMLPKRLGDEWHRASGHSKIKGEDGRRRWHFPKQPVSLERLMADSETAGAAPVEARVLEPSKWTPVPVAVA